MGQTRNLTESDKVYLDQMPIGSWISTPELTRMTLHSEKTEDRTRIASVMYRLRQLGWVSSRKNGEDEFYSHIRHPAPLDPPQGQNGLRVRPNYKRKSKKQKKAAQTVAPPVDPFNVMLERIAEMSGNIESASAGLDRLLDAVASLQDEYGKLVKVRKSMRELLDRIEKGDSGDGRADIE